MENKAGSRNASSVTAVEGSGGATDIYGKTTSCSHGLKQAAFGEQDSKILLVGKG